MLSEAVRGWSGNLLPIAPRVVPVQDNTFTLNCPASARSELHTEVSVALEAERNKFADVFHRSPSFMAILRGPQHIFESVNNRYLDLIGYRNVIGKPARAALPEIEGQGFFELLDTVYATGEPYISKDMQVFLQRQPGEPLEERVVEFVYQATRQPDGTISGVFMHGIDLTERKGVGGDMGRNESAKRRSGKNSPSSLKHRFSRGRDEVVLAELAAIVDSSDDAIVGKTLDGTITSWNAAAKRIFGYTADDIIGRSIMTLIPDDHRDEELQILERLWRGERIEHFETVRVAKDGRRIEMSITASPIRDSAGRIVGVSKIARDITRRKEAEKEHEHLLASERAARSEAEQANRTKDDFLATVSHELRTPLGAMLLWAKLLKDEKLCPEERQSALDVIIHCAEDQTRLVDDLLEATRILHGKVRAEMLPVNLAEVVVGAVDVIHPVAEAKGVEVKLSISDASVVGDTLLLRRIICNLLTNAVKFTPAGGHVEVRLTSNEAGAQLQIIDTGEGIDPILLRHLFDRFWQADGSTTRRHGGLGLGLFIVRHLVELHEGSVRADSQGPGYGATLTVALPLKALRKRPEKQSHRPRP